MLMKYITIMAMIQNTAIIISVTLEVKIHWNCVDFILNGQ